MNTVLMAELEAVAWLAAKHLQQLITRQQRVPWSALLAHCRETRFLDTEKMRFGRNMVSVLSY